MQKFDERLINLIEKQKLNEIDNRPDSRLKKRECLKNGYIWQISFYGCLEDKETWKGRYVRIEVFSNEIMTKRVITRLLELFSMYPPKYLYTIHVYDVKRDKIAMVGYYE